MSVTKEELEYGEARNEAGEIQDSGFFEVVQETWKAFRLKWNGSSEEALKTVEIDGCPLTRMVEHNPKWGLVISNGRWIGLYCLLQERNEAGDNEVLIFTFLPRNFKAYPLN